MDFSEIRNKVGCGVSVLVSNRNQSSLLRYALKGVLRQTYFEEFTIPLAVQVVICDDRSTDSERQALESLVSDLGPEIKKSGMETEICYNDRDCEGWGKGFALNKAVDEVVKHPVLVFLDGDCYPHNMWLCQHYSRQILGLTRLYYYNPMRMAVDSVAIPKGERNFYIGSRFFIPESNISKAKVAIENDASRDLYLLSDKTLWCSVSSLGPGIARMQGCNFSLMVSYFNQVGGFRTDMGAEGRCDDSVLWHDLATAGIVPRPLTDASVFHFGASGYDEWQRHPCIA